MQLRLCVLRDTDGMLHLKRPALLNNTLCHRVIFKLCSFVHVYNLDCLVSVFNGIVDVTVRVVVARFLVLYTLNCGEKSCQYRNRHSLLSLHALHQSPMDTLQGIAGVDQVPKCRCRVYSTASNKTPFSFVSSESIHSFVATILNRTPAHEPFLVLRHSLKRLNHSRIKA